MAQQLINNGTIAGDGTGEVLFSAFDKTNDNFTELYSRIKEAKVVITAAQLKDLVANPKVLIPAAGANKVIKIISITAFLDYGTVAFNFTHDLDIQYQTSSVVIYNGGKTNFNQTTDYFFDIGKIGGLQLSVNQGLVLTTSADATAGDGTVTIIALYSEQDFS